MKDGFTLIEVIILFVIFLMVALLVIPLSVDDTIQARNVAKWRQVHDDFLTIPASVKTFSDDEIDFQNFMTALIKIHPLNKVISYKIKYMNGEQPAEQYVFNEIYNTNAGASLAFKWLETPVKNSNGKDILGLLMYDVNGRYSPNTWGKDIFGMYIYKNSLEALGSGLGKEEIEFDCSKQGTGLYCSEYYLNGGSF